MLHQEWTTHKQQYFQQYATIDSKHLSIEQKRLSLEAKSVDLDKKSPAEREDLLAQERDLAAAVDEVNELSRQLQEPLEKLTAKKDRFLDDAEAMGVELDDIR